MPDQPSLTDDEVADRLHRMAFELEQLSGQSTKGDTALKASRAALLLYLMALVKEPTGTEP
jgi:hypothetical protein